MVDFQGLVTNQRILLQKLPQVLWCFLVKSQCLKQWYVVRVLICFLALPSPFLSSFFTFFFSPFISKCGLAYREQSSQLLSTTIAYCWCSWFIFYVFMHPGNHSSDKNKEQCEHPEGFLMQCPCPPPSPL